MAFVCVCMLPKVCIINVARSMEIDVSIRFVSDSFTAAHLFHQGAAWGGAGGLEQTD